MSPRKPSELCEPCEPSEQVEPREPVGSARSVEPARPTQPAAVRRVAVIGGTRIPFARSDGPYATASHQGTLITAGGRSVAPAPLEDWLRSHPLISQCVVLGDGRPYVSALITLALDGITHWRRMNGKHPVPAELLVDDEELRAVLQRAVDEVNRTLSRPESNRRCTVLPFDFRENAGRLTPSMQLRCEAILRDFAEEVEGLYPGS
ncbi:hypothetical protein SHIRM173S_03203 [Streptomyces hirsutus]